MNSISTLVLSLPSHSNRGGASHEHGCQVTSKEGEEVFWFLIFPKKGKALVLFCSN
jgi:hypothetical protein